MYHYLNPHTDLWDVLLSAWDEESKAEGVTQRHPAGKREDQALNPASLALESTL